MYIDTILFIIGGVCTLLALSFAIYLVASRKRNKAYRILLEQETAHLDGLTTTWSLAQKSKSTGSVKENEDRTELLTDGGETEWLSDGDRTEFLDNDEEDEILDFDQSALEGKYIVKREIHGGGMSRVFLAESAKLGNTWIVKFISSQAGGLANEENILKLLNHINLPRIIDIFHDEKGVYLVESFVEGISLDQVLKSEQKLSQVVVLEWAEQLAQVLSYLHGMEPQPIYHLDLKPSNIMVTHNNKLVLIDFGISKKLGEDRTATIGVTYNYAAPEQLKHRIPQEKRPVIEHRFGELPAKRMYWSADGRTDIFSLGVILFELATGQIPTKQNAGLLREVLSQEVFQIIEKCLAIDPKDRYQHVGEFLADLQKSKGNKVKIAHALFMRKLAAALTGVFLVGAAGSLAGGYYVYAQENGALLEVAPEILTVSLQQSADLVVEKFLPGGQVKLLDNTKVRWGFDNENIARIDGNRIAGLNVGTTEVMGKYRMKTISLRVNVVEPMDGMVEISQRYQVGHRVELYAGTMEREHLDGMLSESEFVSPESLDIAEDGTIYVTDSGVFRKIKDGKVESIYFEPAFLTAHMVRCHGNDVFILTDPWEDEDGVYYGIIKLSETGAEGLYLSDARYTAVEDFGFDEKGLMYFIDRNEGASVVTLKTLNPENVEDIQVICDLPKGTAALAMGEQDVIYLANPETGTIQIHREGELSYFAGTENEKAFIDGVAPLFYEPQRLQYEDGFLFVWDFNVLRRIEVQNNGAVETITLAGQASPSFAMEIPKEKWAAEDVVMPNSKLMDFAVIGDRVLLTDPKRGVLWEVF